MASSKFVQTGDGARILRKKSKPKRMSRAATTREAIAGLADVGIHLDPSTRVDALPRAITTALVAVRAFKSKQ